MPRRWCDKAHREIREIRGVTKIAQAPGDADQQITVPAGDDEIGVVEHERHPFAVVHGSPFTQRRSAIQFDDGIQVEIVTRSGRKSWRQDGGCKFPGKLFAPACAARLRAESHRSYRRSRAMKPASVPARSARRCAASNSP